MTHKLLVCDRPAIVGHALELGALEADGALVVLVGAWAPLFALIEGRARLASGRLDIAGAPAENAAARGAVGLCPKQAPLPEAARLGELLTDSARLLGFSARGAKKHAESAAGELGLGGRLGERVERLSAPERRAASIVMATLGEPGVLCVEDPFGGLEPSGHAFIAMVLRRALRGRRGLVAVPELPGSSEQDAFVQSADELLVLGVPGVVARGRYGELMAQASARRVVVTRNAEALSERLEQQGYSVQLVSLRALTSLVVGDPTALGTRPILDAAAEVDAPIIELVAMGAGGAG